MEFWNPIFNEAGKRRGIYRVERLPAEHVEAFLPRTTPRWGWIAGAAVPFLVLVGLVVRRGRGAGDPRARRA